jgi:hypothetical protein
VTVVYSPDYPIRFYTQLTGLTSTVLRFNIRMTNRYQGVRLAIIAGKATASAWQR